MVNLCIERGFSVIQDEGYNPFHGRSEEEQRDWLLFAMHIGDLELQHTEWLLQGGSDIEREGHPSPFQNPDRWLGELGDKWRAKNFTSWQTKL